MPYSFRLIRESLQILFKNFFYLLRFWLFRIGLLLLLLIPLGIGLIFSNSWVMYVGISISTILAVVYGIWLSATSFVITKSMVEGVQLPVKALAKLSWEKMGKLLMANFLSGLLIALGLILLIVPGIIFVFWFYFTAQVVIYEDLSGKAALSRSKALVKGHFWWLVKNLAVYFGVSLLVTMLLGFAVSLTPFSENIQKIIISPVNFIEATIGMIYSFLLYRDLVKSK